MNQITGFPDVTKVQLEAAWMAELGRAPSTAEAHAFATEVINLTLSFEAAHHLRDRARRQNDLASFKQGVSALLADLIFHASNIASAGFMYRASDRGQFTKTLCSSRVFETLTKDLWPLMGLIEVTKGFQTWDDFDGDRIRGYGKAQRYRATPKLLSLAKAFGICPENTKDHFAVSHDKSHPVEVRGRKQGPNWKTGSQIRLKAPKSPKLDENLEIIRDLNRFMEQHSFSLSDKPRFKRMFNNGHLRSFDYDQGGRIYCTSSANYQIFPEAEREEILIDGGPVSEIDVSASQLSIFYWVHGEKMPQDRDPYDIPKIDRDVSKKIVVTAFGAGKMPGQWPKHFKEEYQSKTGRELTKDYKLSSVVSALLEHHPLLRNLDPNQPEWARLQYYESEAILGAIRELKDAHGIVALPVHDSLIVKKSDQKTAMLVLSRNYDSRFGFFPNLKATYSWNELP